MNTYKITNITDMLGKRDIKFNTIVNIEYVDDMKKKIISVKPTEVVYLSASSLPISVHGLRMKNLITVDEISKSELASIQASQAKPVAQPIVPVETDDTELKQNRKKSSK